jgi:hypothetical protein
LGCIKVDLEWSSTCEPHTEDTTQLKEIVRGRARVSVSSIGEAFLGFDPHWESIDIGSRGLAISTAKGLARDYSASEIRKLCKVHKGVTDIVSSIIIHDFSII